MAIYFVQHGEAVGPDLDPMRPLSERGRTQTARLAEAAVRRGVIPAVVWHSGKLRARQTAEIFWRACNPLAALQAVRGLQPDGSASVAPRRAGRRAARDSPCGPYAASAPPSEDAAGVRVPTALRSSFLRMGASRSSLMGTDGRSCGGWNSKPHAVGGAFRPSSPPTRRSENATGPRPARRAARRFVRARWRVAARTRRLRGCETGRRHRSR